MLQCQYSLNGNLVPKYDAVPKAVDRFDYVSFLLTHDIMVDIAPNRAVRVINPRMDSAFTLSHCTTQMCVVHPMGRMFQHNSSIFMEVSDDDGAKRAKMCPKGITFAADNNVLVYLIDEAGVRSTTDRFYDLGTKGIVDGKFKHAWKKSMKSVKVN